MQATLDRFFAKVDLTLTCWLWRGAVGTRGYGVWWHGRRLVRPHVFAYVLFVGPIPEGLEIDHVCGNKLCVNPLHLEAVSHSENMLRWYARRAEPIK
jgi:hypothetical protein